MSQSPRGLVALHSAVMVEAGTFIRPRDVVNFTPHLTLARLPSAKRLTAEVEALATVSIGPRFTVDEAVLMESETRREGAVHHPVARLPLG